MNEKIQEWRQLLRYVISHLVKKNFQASNQYYPSLRHEQEVMPNKSDMVRFTSIPDPTRGVHCNKENFPVDLLEDTHAGKKCCSLVFHGIKS